MSLQNLLKIGALAEHVTAADQVDRMLASAGRSIDDARQESISLETRLDAAYRAVMQVSMVALWANGLRPSKSAPGHHSTMIQSLTHSVGLDNDRMLVLGIIKGTVTVIHCGRRILLDASLNYGHCPLNYRR